MAEVLDCFLFNDELDLLEHRLRVLSPVVSTFVIVESTMTFQGGSKPLHLSEHWARFEQWEAKIRRVILRDLPGDITWEREYAQHRAIKATLTDYAPDDLVLVGDCDEIPFPEVIEQLREDQRPPTRLHMRHAVYWANTDAATSVDQRNDGVQMLRDPRSSGTPR